MPEDLQKSVFKKQLAIARQYQLPLVIHCRDADQDCLEILKEVRYFLGIFGFM